MIDISKGRYWDEGIQLIDGGKITVSNAEISRLSAGLTGYVRFYV